MTTLIFIAGFTLGFVITLQLTWLSQETKMTLTVDDDGMLTIPDDMLEQLGWNVGDVLEFIDNNDGSFSVVKVDERV